jgi:hypothetical protein
LQHRCNTGGCENPTAAVLAQVLALYGCLAWVQLSLRPDYILVIDCGSTGTRM